MPAFSNHPNLETLNPAETTPPNLDPDEVSGYNSPLDDPIGPAEVDRLRLNSFIC